MNNPIPISVVLIIRLGSPTRTVPFGEKNIIINVHVITPTYAKTNEKKNALIRMFLAINTPVVLEVQSPSLCQDRAKVQVFYFFLKV